jgi:hypothetical protein
VRRWRDAAIIYTANDWENQQPHMPYYIPFANGTPPVRTGLHQDTDDAAYISDKLCWVLHFNDDPCKCLDLETSCPANLEMMTLEPAEDCRIGPP